MGKEIEHNNPRISPKNCPDISQGKAVMAASAGVILGGGFTALAISVGAILVIFVCSIVYGIAEALLAL